MLDSLETELLNESWVVAIDADNGWVGKLFACKVVELADDSGFICHLTNAALLYENHTAHAESITYLAQIAHDGIAHPDKLKVVPSVFLGFVDTLIVCSPQSADESLTQR